MKGRKPKATVLHILSGTDRPRNARPNEPDPVGDLGEPPVDLNDSEKAIWRSAIEHAPPELLRKLDGHLLRLWCEAWATRLAARARVTAEGMVVDSPKHKVPMKSPFQSIVDQQTEIIRHLTSELGFSPTSRSRIKVSGSASKAANRFANNAAKRA